jgi:SAM-dependent methyltransferase
MNFSDYILNLSPQDVLMFKFSTFFRRKIRLDSIKPFDINNESTLEIGPGDNPLLKNASFMEYLPAEELSKILGYKKDKICCDIVGSISNIPVNEKVFKATASVHVVEHTVDPIQSIREQIRVTKDKGYVLIVVPNFRANKFDFKRKPLDISFFIEQHEDDNKIRRNTSRQIDEVLKFNPRPPELAQRVRSGTARPHYYTYSAKLLEDLIFEACNLERRNASLKASFYHYYSHDILAMLQLDSEGPLAIKGHICSAMNQAEARRKIISIIMENSSV